MIRERNLRGILNEDKRKTECIIKALPAISLNYQQLMVDPNHRHHSAMAVELPHVVVVIAAMMGQWPPFVGCRRAKTFVQRSKILLLDIYTQ